MKVYTEPKIQGYAGNEYGTHTQKLCPDLKWYNSIGFQPMLAGFQPFLLHKLYTVLLCVRHFCVCTLHKRLQNVLVHFW